MQKQGKFLATLERFALHHTWSAHASRLYPSCNTKCQMIPSDATPVLQLNRAVLSPQFGPCRIMIFRLNSLNILILPGRPIAGRVWIDLCAALQALVVANGSTRPLHNARGLIGATLGIDSSIHTRSSCTHTRYLAGRFNYEV